MSIEHNWKQLNEQGDDDLSSLLQPGYIKKLHSKNPLQKIRQLLLFSLAWAVVISFAYICIMIAFPHWPIVLCLLVVLAFNFWVGYITWKQYRSIDTRAIGQFPLLAEMERHFKGINEWMKLQMKVAIYVYPVAAAGGFMLGGILGSGKSIAVFMSKPIVIISLLITIAVLVPVCIWVAKWLFRKSYGKHLAILKKNIEELKKMG